MPMTLKCNDEAEITSQKISNDLELEQSEPPSKPKWKQPELQLLCKNCPQIMNFWREFFTAGGRENVFYSAAGSQFVATGPAKILKIGQKLTFLCPKWILNRDFALTGEIIHDNKFSFYAIFFT